MKKQILIILTSILLIVSNWGSSKTATGAVSDHINIATGIIHGFQLTDTHIYYSLQDSISKLFSLYSYKVDTGETKALATNRKKINLFTYNTNSVYAANEYVMWLEDSGLWGWIPQKNETRLISTIPFNNGIGMLEDSVAFSDNWSQKPGIYLQELKAPYTKNCIFDFRFKHQFSYLKTSSKYITWIDTSKNITDDPRKSALVTHGDIMLYDVKNNTKTTIDSSGKRKEQPVLHKGNIVYIEYLSETSKQMGANVVYYNIETGTRKNIFTLNPKASCLIINNPDSNKVMLKIDSQNECKIVAIDPDNLTVEQLAISVNTKNCFKTNSQFAFDDAYLSIEYSNTDQKWQLINRNLGDNTTTFIDKSDSIGLAKINLNTIAWISQNKTSLTVLKMVKRGSL